MIKNILKTITVAATIACTTSLQAQDYSCDDFTDIALYPEDSYAVDAGMVGDIIGYTQDGTQPITINAVGDGWLSINDFDSGFYGGTELDFAFDGSNQTVRFLTYGWIGEGTTIGFSVNGSSLITFDESFPMEVDGITVDIDLSPEDEGSFEYFYLILSGEIDNVTHLMFESGIEELCINPVTEPETICDDFTTDPWPAGPVTYTEGDLVGYSQDGTQPITVGPGSSCTFSPSNEGIYVWDYLNFTFDGSNQIARFEIYGSIGQYNDMGFTVNASAPHYMDETFPMEIGGVTIDLDASAEDFDGWDNAYLIFSGEIDEIDIIGFESGIKTLCVEPSGVELLECDNFTGEPWAMDEIFEPGDIIGYVQDGANPVTVGATGTVLVNTDMTYFPGLFLNNAPLIFDFDGSHQIIQFEIYEWFGAGSEGFELNGEPLVLFDATYPTTIGGVDVDLVMTGETIGTADVAYLTFDGEIDEIVMVGGELGITELCYAADTVGTDLSIHEETNQHVKLYPNPAHQSATVSSDEIINTIRIYNVSGELVYQSTVANTQVNLNLETFEQGFYLVKLSLMNGEQIIEKLIRE